MKWTSETTNKQHDNFFKIMISKKSIFSQSRMKKSETSITHSFEYFIAFNSENIRHDSIDKSINDKTFLTMFANKKWTRKCRKRNAHRRRKKSKNSRNWYANRLFDRCVHCWKCFEFDRFENRWNRRIEIWRNARLYRIIVFRIAFVKTAWKQRFVLTWLQIKWFRLFSEYAIQIVHDQIESRWYKISRRNKWASNVCVFQKFAHRFECRNRETWKFRCNDWTWCYFCSEYRLSWCCNRREFWRDFAKRCAFWTFAYNFWCEHRKKYEFRWNERWKNYRSKWRKRWRFESK